MSKNQSKLDLLTETVIPLTDVSKLLPSGPSHKTVWRWSTRGLRGVVLNTVRLGQKTYTSEEEVTRFLDAIQ